MLIEYPQEVTWATDILEVACGAGDLSYAIRKLLPQASVTGLDSDAHCINEALAHR